MGAKTPFDPHPSPPYPPFRTPVVEDVRALALSASTCIWARARQQPFPANDLAGRPLVMIASVANRTAGCLDAVSNHHADAGAPAQKREATLHKRHILGKRASREGEPNRMARRRERSDVQCPIPFHDGAPNSGHGGANDQSIPPVLVCALDPRPPEDPVSP